MSTNYNQKYLSQWFDADFETGTLKWKKAPRGVSAGTKAGMAQGKDKAPVVMLQGHEYPVHKILWTMKFGDNPLRMYHKNGDKSDNRISNLARGLRNSRAVVSKAKAFAEDPEREMCREAREKARLIQPRRDPMIWSMFGGAAL